jgi:hypothetical protein
VSCVIENDLVEMGIGEKGKDTLEMWKHVPPVRQ